MTQEFLLLSRDAQTWLTEFDLEFQLALAGEATPWARSLGAYRQSKVKVVWPIAISTAGYKEFKGDVLYRELSSKSFELIPKTWQDGYAELASKVEAPDFFGWNDEPSKLAVATIRLGNEWVRDILQNNPLCWDGSNFFATTHKANVLKGTDTFSNLTTADTPITTENLKKAKSDMRKIPSASGKDGDRPRLGLRMTHMLVRPDEEQQARDLLEQDMVIQAIAGTSQFGAVDNRHKGSVELVVCDELTDKAWYALALNKTGMRPWATIDEGAPETIIQGKNDALYKTTLKVGYASIVRGFAGAAMPHPIHRYEFA